jgi:alkylation response protein AidB-like acyl-CoA dehydrogenase
MTLMTSDILPRTEPGHTMVRLAEQHAADFGTRAAHYDREGSFAFEHIQALKTSGMLAATVPHTLGGFGVDSVHDCVVAMQRLGRGDGSTTLAFNMHTFRTLALTRRWRQSLATGQQAQAAQTEQLLRQIGAGELFIAVTNAERGVVAGQTHTEATPTTGGWLINGTKTFGTGSPAADLLAVRMRYRTPAGAWRLGAALVPAHQPGVHIAENWNALGMRGSGSHDVVFTNCFVPHEALEDVGAWGQYSLPVLVGSSATVLGLAAVFLGIAETAHQITRTAIVDRGHAHSPLHQYAVGETEVDLGAARAMLAYTAQAVDTFYATYPGGDCPNSAALQLITDCQCSKYVITKKAVDIVDRALTLSGGAGYANTHPLARLYRDVRAGPLMQPFSALTAFEFIGKVALGVDPLAAAEALAGRSEPRDESKTEVGRT